jgi:hypothetical protein
MMADATHTQGPWKVKFQESRRDTTHYTDRYWYDQWAIKGPNKSHSPVAMVRVEGLGSGPSKAVRKANAILIAAAPDLLAVVCEMLGAAETDLLDDKSNVWRSAMISAREAISKAKGG